MKTRPQANRASNARKTALRWSRLLVPVDFSTQSRQAVKFAGTLARDMGGKLDLVFVVEPIPHYSGLEYTPVAHDSAEIAQEARDELRRMAQKEIPADVPVTVIVRRGKGPAEIATTATQRKTSLIIIPTHGYSGVQRALLGSTTEQVIRRAPCAVLTLRSRTTPKEGLALRRILAPVDFSEGSQRALEYAAAFAQRKGAELVVFHTVLSMPPPRRMAAFARGVQLETLKYAREDLATLVEEVVPTGVARRTELIAGIPREEIVRAAIRWKTDLITMGTHGRRGLERWVMGSTAEQVVRHAPCPVLVVRQPKQGRRKRRKVEIVFPTIPLPP